MKQFASSHQILVVDDDSAQRRTLRDVFFEEGFDVVTCATISESVSFCQRHDFVVAIVDLVLGAEDGLELVRQLQELRPKMRTIVHTGHGSFDSAKKAIDLRAFAYVEKDDDPSELINRVHHAVEAVLSEALSESEERFRHLLDDVVAIVWEAELPSLRFTFVSKHAETILGYPVSQWLSEPDFWVNHLHQDDREWCIEYCQQCTARGEQHEFDYRAVAADGRVVWLHDVVHVVADEAGQPYKLRGVMFDVTARKEAERNLQEAEEQRARTEEIALVMTVHLTLDGEFLKAPQRFCEYLGYSREELLGRSADDFTHPDDRLEDGRRRKRLLAGEIESFEHEKRHLCKDGQVVWSYSNCSTVTDSEGQPLYLRCYVTDITSRKEAEEALRASEAHYRSLVDCSPICIHEIDLNGKLASVNPAGLKMIDAPDRSTVLGNDYLDFVGAADRPRVESLMNAAFGGKSSTFTFRTKIKQQEHLFASNFIPIFDENGVVTMLMGTTEDITERATAEASLRISEERFRQLAENINAVLWMRSADGAEQLYVSPKYEEIWGASLETLEKAPETFVETVVEEDRPKLERAFHHLRNGGRAEDYDLEYRIQRPDGEIRWIHDRGFSICDSQGHVIRQAGFAEDVTESRQALEQVHIRGRAIASANVGIVISDVTLENRPLIYCNPAFEQMTGYSKHELVGRNWRLLWAGDEQQEGATDLGDAVAAERECSTLIRCYTKQGDMFWDQISISPVHDRDGRLTHCVGFHTDVTERVEADSKLREREAQLAHVARLSTMGEMVAGIAHEINQPLSAIANFALASLNAVTTTDQEYEVPLEQWLDSINRQAVHCGDIIRRLRNYVRKGDDRRERTDLKAVVRDSVALIKSDTRHSAASIECHLPSREIPILVNPIQLQQVIVNLLRNACDAAAEVDTPRVKIRVEQETWQTRLTVEDNGRGVDASERQKLFDTFYTTKPEGMGMGLAISKSIIEAHGGRLRFDTEATHATSFHIELPQNESVKKPTPS